MKKVNEGMHECIGRLLWKYESGSVALITAKLS